MALKTDNYNKVTKMLDVQVHLASLEKCGRFEVTF